MKKVTCEEAVKIGSFVCIWEFGGELQAEQFKDGYLYTGYEKIDDDPEAFQPEFYQDAEFYVAGE